MPNSFNAPSPDLPFTASALLDAARTELGHDWMVSPGTSGMTGGLRSHRGHNIALRGARNGFVYAIGVLPDGSRRQVSAVPAARTAAAYGAALARIVTHELVPAHDACCPARISAKKASAVVPYTAYTSWAYGEAATTWDLPGGGWALHITKVIRDDPAYVASSVTFNSLTVEQGVTVLRAINTDSRDRRRHLPVYGPLAEQLRTAAPGLRPGDTYDRHGHGLTTVSLFVDGVVDVKLHLVRSSPVELTVIGSMDNQLRAIDAL